MKIDKSIKVKICYDRIGWLLLGNLHNLQNLVVIIETA